MDIIAGSRRKFLILMNGKERSLADEPRVARGSDRTIA
jgi:hypothetical protein